jgi:hypothetical protein
VLINNAGAMFARRELTVDGFEKTFAINHLAPFLLTNLLLDLLLTAPAGRIIMVASESHSRTLPFDNLQGERDYNFFRAYAISKLCNILFTHGLARLLEGTHTTVNSMSPGPTKTQFGSDMTGLPGLFPKFMKMIPFLFGSPEKGAATLVHLASASSVGGVTGKFFVRGHERRTKKITYDRAVAERLWRVSQELCAGVAAPSGAPARAGHSTSARLPWSKLSHREPGIFGVSMKMNPISSAKVAGKFRCAVGIQDSPGRLLVLNKSLIQAFRRCNFTHAQGGR